MAVKESIQKLIDANVFSTVLNEKEYYYQKLKDLHQLFQHYDVTGFQNRLQTEVVPALENRSTYFKTEQFLQNFSNDPALYNFFLLMIKMNCYIDEKAYNKNQWNEYADKRVLSRPQTPMPYAIKFLIWLKISPEKLPTDHIFISCLNYLQHPERNTIIMSDNHKKNIANLLWDGSYNSSNFFDGISNWFQQNIKYSIVNPINEPIFWSQVMYHPDVKLLWNKDVTSDKLNGDQEKKTTNSNFPYMPALNAMLYGPPGTGKTYHTINKSVAIANPQFDIANANRQQLKDEYERLMKEGQIEFVTFHQSMSYEDFIEGIKPVEPKEGDPFLKYEIKEGIFKRLCERASKVPDTKPTGFSISEDEFQKAGFYKISLGDTSNPDDDMIYAWCIKNGYIALGYGDAIDFIGKKESDIQQMVPAQLEKFAVQAVNYFIHYLKQGDYVVVTYGNLQFRAIGKVTGNYEYKNVAGLNVHQFRKVEWLLKDVELPYEEAYNKQFSQQTIYRLDKREIKKEFFVKVADAASLPDTKPKNYVLVIDEINRGNISQIFGELITLIEEDKRAGKPEALTITLPYSKKSFSVPANLYIIGTMNTADRSVEALDTALRRRFTFEQMLPDSEQLSPQNLISRLYVKHAEKDWENEAFRKEASELYALIGIDQSFEAGIKIDGQPYDVETDKIQQLKNDQFAGVNLQTLLSSINNRLEVLLTKDHTVGHAWLMNVFSLDDLRKVFKNKILPLLQEFFYNDYAKIGLVLGDKFVQQTKVAKSVFARFKEENDLVAEYEDKIIYALTNPNEISLEDFKSIYA